MGTGARERVSIVARDAYRDPRVCEAVTPHAHLSPDGSRDPVYRTDTGSVCLVAMDDLACDVRFVGDGDASGDSRC